MEGPKSWVRLFDRGKVPVSAMLQRYQRDLWNHRDLYDWTLLDLACRAGDLPALVKLIQAGVDVDIEKNMLNAIKGRHVCIIEVLCSMGAKFNMTVELFHIFYLFDAEAFECACMLVANGMRCKNIPPFHNHSIDPNIIKFEQGVLQCRSNVIVILGIKKYRVSNLKTVDRFLIREIALAVWASKKKY